MEDNRPHERSLCGQCGALVLGAGEPNHGVDGRRNELRASHPRPLAGAALTAADAA